MMFMLLFEMQNYLIFLELVLGKKPSISFNIFFSNIMLAK